jgi:hypothetical protein
MVTNLLSSFGFAKFFDVRDSENCIRGFFRLGYEVGFARVTTPVTVPTFAHSSDYECDHSIPRLSTAFCCHKHAMMAIPKPGNVDFFGTNILSKQESFNSRLKAEGDDESTNLYISNLPRHFSEAVSLNRLVAATSLTSCRNSVPYSLDTPSSPARFFEMAWGTAVVLDLLGKFDLLHSWNERPVN